MNTLRCMHDTTREGWIEKGAWQVSEWRMACVTQHMEAGDAVGDVAYEAGDVAYDAVGDVVCSTIRMDQKRAYLGYLLRLRRGQIIVARIQIHVVIRHRVQIRRAAERKTKNNGKTMKTLNVVLCQV